MRSKTILSAILMLTAVFCFWACDSDNNSNSSVDTQNITGIVSNEDGQTVIPNASVTLTGESEDGQTITRTTTTDSAGYYNFKNIPPGDYSVSCEAWLNGKPFAAIIQKFNLGADGFEGTMNLIMREAGAIAGLVILPDNTRVPGATVELMLEADTTQTKQDETDPRLPLMNKTTDGTGFYEFEMVPIGSYSLKVSKEGYPEVIIKNIAVQAGQTLALDITLEADPDAKGTLTGFVYTPQTTGVESIKSDGPEFLIPVSGAAINIYNAVLDLADSSIAPPDDLGEPVYTTASDENGEYKIDDIEPGEYLAICTADGYNPRHYYFRMPAGALLHHDFILHAETTTGGIAGTVSEDTGDATVFVPIYNAHVYINPSSYYIDGEAASPLPEGIRHYMDTWTNEGGEFEFTEVPIGSYFMWTAAENYNPDNMRAVEVLEDEITTVNVKLKPIIQETGALEGTVTDYADNPLPGARIDVYHSLMFEGNAESSSMLPIATTTTDESGVYNFDSLPAGPVNVVANKGGYARANDFIDIIADETVTLDFQLLPEKTLTIVGVLKKLETPENCWAIYTNNSDSELFEPAGPLAEEMKALPNADGMHVEVEGFIIETFAPTCSGGPALEIVRYLVLPTPGGLQGQVTDEAGNPIAEATVKAYPQIPTLHEGEIEAEPNAFLPLFFETKTDTEGNYAFDNLIPEMYSVVVSKDGYLISAKEIEVPEGETVNLDFTLETPPPPGNLSGHVYDTEAGPIAGVMVKILMLDMPTDAAELSSAGNGTESNYSEYKAETDEEGAYLIEGIPAGTYDAVACKEGYVTTYEPVEIISEETAAQDFVLEKLPPIVLVGTLRYLDLEGGCWQFQTAAGENYEPVGEKAQELFAEEGADGALVMLTGYRVNDMASICMVGTIFLVEDYQILSTTAMAVEYRKYNLEVDDTTMPYIPHVLRIFEGGTATLCLREPSTGAFLNERLVAAGPISESLYNEMITYIDANDMCNWEIEPPACDCICPEFFIKLPYCGDDTRYDIMPACLAPPEAFAGFQSIMDEIEESLPLLTE